MRSAMRTERYRLGVWVARDDHSKIAAIERYDHDLDPPENTKIAKVRTTTNWATSCSCNGAKAGRAQNPAVRPSVECSRRRPRPP